MIHTVHHKGKMVHRTLKKKGNTCIRRTPKMEDNTYMHRTPKTRIKKIKKNQVTSTSVWRARNSQKLFNGPNYQPSCMAATYWMHIFWSHQSGIILVHPLLRHIIHNENGGSWTTEWGKNTPDKSTKTIWNRKNKASWWETEWLSKVWPTSWQTLDLKCKR